MLSELAQVRFDMAPIILSWAVKHENIPNKYGIKKSEGVSLQDDITHIHI